MLWKLTVFAVLCLCLCAWWYFKQPIYQAPASISIVRRLDAAGPHNQEAERLLSQSRFAELRTILERSIAEYPTSPAAHYNLGVACEAENDLIAAKEQYAEALRHDPSHEKATEALAWLGRVERYKAAADAPS